MNASLSTTEFRKHVHERYLYAHERLYDVFALHEVSVIALRVLANSEPLVQQFDVALAQSHAFDPARKNANKEEFWRKSFSNARNQVAHDFLLTRQNSLVSACSNLEYLVKRATAYEVLVARPGIDASCEFQSGTDLYDQFETLDDEVTNLLKLKNKSLGAKGPRASILRQLDLLTELCRGNKNEIYWDHEAFSNINEVFVVRNLIVHRGAVIDKKAKDTLDGSASSSADKAVTLNEAAMRAYWKTIEAVAGNIYCAVGI